MKHPKSTHNSVPNDIAHKIASLLEVSDLCALGSCSRFWREQCGSDPVWAALCKDRWPVLGLNFESIGENQHHLDSTLKGWRGFYITKHKEMERKAISVTRLVERCLSSESIEGNHYQKAIQDMCSMQFGFRDVKLFFLKNNLHVLLNLAGLHHCITSLKVPAESVIEALSSCKISQRRVCVQWWKSGGWLYRFRLPDESFSRRVSLRDLTMAEEEEVLGVLRGATRGVLRVQISAAEPISPP